MKTIKMLFATALVAVGMSASAANMSSDVYAVITVPVNGGNNLIGISVAPMVENAMATDVLSIGENTTLFTTGSENVSASQAPVSVGSAVWYNIATDAEKFQIYQTGLEAKEKVTSSLSAGSLMAVSSSATVPVDPARWGFAGTPLPSGKADLLYIWNGEGYDTYYFNSRDHKFHNKVGNAVANLSINPGAGVFIKVGTAQNITH